MNTTPHDHSDDPALDSIESRLETMGASDREHAPDELLDRLRRQAPGKHSRSVLARIGPWALAAAACLVGVIYLVSPSPQSPHDGAPLASQPGEDERTGEELLIGGDTLDEALAGISLHAPPVAVLKPDLCTFGDPFVIVIILLKAPQDKMGGIVGE